MFWLEIAISILTTVLLVPVVVLCAECLAALLPQKDDRPSPSQATSSTERAPLIVLIPAYNEEAGLAAMLARLMPQLRPGDRCIVVADNCTDGTVAVAGNAGVEIVERHDELNRGKGFALEAGRRYCADSPASTIILLDADCELADGTIETLWQTTRTSRRPVQAAYVLDRPAGASPRDMISAFAFLLRNRIRPRGLHCLGLPCVLTGSGMAFPWPIFQSARLANASIVEDMQLTIDLAVAGTPPVFCEQSRVTGRLPADADAARVQRTRWEHGHLRVLLTAVPQLFLAWLRRPKVSLLGLAMDMCVPPLSLLVLLMIAGSIVTAGGGLLTGHWHPLQAMIIGFSLMAMCLTAVWARFGRAVLPASAAWKIPFYIIWKIPIYCGFLIHQQRQWIRTPRDSSDQTT